VSRKTIYHKSGPKPDWLPVKCPCGQILFVPPVLFVLCHQCDRKHIRCEELPGQVREKRIGGP
jgi:hypothetical protein